MNSLRHGIFLVLELMLKLCVAPRLRARLISFLGARVGRNVRIYSCTFINLRRGFSHLSVEDDAHIGTDCLIDLEGPVQIGRGSTLSPRVMVLSHSDPGASHGSPLTASHPPTSLGVKVGAFTWIGAGTTILDGSAIGDRVVVGAQALVRGHLPDDSTYVGIPAKRLPVK